MTKPAETDELLDIAAALFCARGYGGTSTRDIAAAADMRLGSLSYRFATKEMILEAIMARGLSEALSGAEPIRRQHKDAETRFVKLVEYHFELINGGRNDIKTILLEWRHLGPDAARRLTAIRDRYEEIWSNAIDDLLKTHGGRSALEKRVFRFSVLGALNWSHNWRNEQGSASNRRLGGSIASIFLDALKGHDKEKGERRGHAAA